MRHAEQVRHLKTLLERLEAGTTVDAGGFRRNPTSSYVDSELAAEERHHFFHRYPQVVGLTGDLGEPGAFLTFNELDIPVLATRDGDGAFRAFVNSCRHRGVILEERPRGNARRFVCPFHNWTYDSAGTLVGLAQGRSFRGARHELPRLDRAAVIGAARSALGHPRPERRSRPRLPTR